MNATDIEDHLAELNTRSEEMGNVNPETVLVVRPKGHWCVMVSRPKIVVWGLTPEEAFAEAAQDMSKHEMAHHALARTLGLEAAE